MRFSAAFERVRFESVSTELAERLAVLRAARPTLGTEPPVAGGPRPPDAAESKS